MKKTIFILSVLIFIIALGRITMSKGQASATLDDGCKCYANGHAHSPDTTLCLGGFRARCIARTGVGEEARDCGWDYLRDSNGDYIRCP
jgi:hypothetical protein